GPRGSPMRPRASARQRGRPCSAWRSIESASGNRKIALAPVARGETIHRRWRCKSTAAALSRRVHPLYGSRKAPATMGESESKREETMTISSSRLACLKSALLAGVIMAAWPAAAAEVTAQRLVNADQEPQNWLMNHRTYDGQRYSPLDRI